MSSSIATLSFTQLFPHQSIIQHSPLMPRINTVQSSHIWPQTEKENIIYRMNCIMFLSYYSKVTFESNKKTAFQMSAFLRSPQIVQLRQKLDSFLHAWPSRSRCRDLCNDKPNFDVVKVLESFLQHEQNLMTTDVSTGIMKRTQMCALNAALKERSGRASFPLIIQLYIVKKLGGNCLTRLPASCTDLICLIGYLISSTRLGILRTPRRPGSGSDPFPRL